MKNSLFKRAFAAAAAVPLALTQCLSVANAVYVNDTAQVTAKNAVNEQVVTLDDGSSSAIFYIAPGKNKADATDGYTRNGKTFEKDSIWNSKITQLLNQVASGSRRTGTIDASEMFNQAIEKSGRFKEVTRSLVEKISDITYAVSDNGDVTIKATLDDITPTFTAGGSNTIGGALKELADEYGIEDLDVPDNFYEGVVIGGDIEIVAYSSSLKDGTTSSGYVKFTDKATGKVYEGTQIIDWALEEFDILKSTAKDACAKYTAYGIDMADAEKKIEDSVSFYVNKLEMVKDLSEKALTYQYESKTASNITPILEKINNQLKKKLNRTLPGLTGSAIAADQNYVNMYNSALSQINDKVQPFVVDIPADVLGEFADGFYDVQASTDNGVATFTAKFEDSESEAAMAYIKSTYNVDPKASYKEINVVVDFSGAKSGVSSADLKVKRVVEVEDIVTTTTTTTTTGSTTTTTTTVDPSVSTTSTTTTGDPSVITTTSTTTGDLSVNTTTSTTTADPSVNTTTSTTTADPSVNTTTSTTTTADPSVNTTTSTTTTGDPSVNTTTSTTTTGDPSVNTTTSTTTTGDPSVNTTTSTTTTGEITPGGTTTRAVKEYVVNFSVEADPGFYLNIDTEFNLNQINTLDYSVDYSEVYYDENDEVVGQSVLQKGEKVDMKGLVEFKDEPSKVFADTESVNIFSHQIPVYAIENIVADDGTVIARAGEAITRIDGSKVSVTAYVGVKGDATLDGIATGDDASATLTYYSKVSTGAKPEETVFSNEAALMNDPLLDDFAAFLCDVDNENDPDNYKKLKPARTIIADDATIILTAYSRFSTGTDANRETWNEILGVDAKV